MEGQTRLFIPIGLVVESARRSGGDRPWLFRGSRDDLRMITIHKHFEITRLRGMRPYRGLKLFLSVGVCRPGEVRVDTNLDPEMLTEVAVHG